MGKGQDLDRGDRVRVALVPNDRTREQLPVDIVGKLGTIESITRGPAGDDEIYEVRLDDGRVVDLNAPEVEAAKVRGFTRAELRHLGRLFRLGARPAVSVYESIGEDFFLAPAPGWLNLGLWERPDEDPAVACARLVETLAQPLPHAAVILDVANGLGEQDLVLRAMVEPRTLIALNLTAFQLRAGADRLRRARAVPLNADATRIPLADASVDGIISVEAAFHFPSRARFFAEARRVLRPGGVLTMSDITAERRRGSLKSMIAGITQMRFWGIRYPMLASAGTSRTCWSEPGSATCMSRS